MNENILNETEKRILTQLCNDNGCCAKTKAHLLEENITWFNGSDIQKMGFSKHQAAGYMGDLEQKGMIANSESEEKYPWYVTEIGITASDFGKEETINHKAEGEQIMKEMILNDIVEGIRSAASLSKSLGISYDKARYHLNKLVKESILEIAEEHTDAIYYRKKRVEVEVVEETKPVKTPRTNSKAEKLRTAIKEGTTDEALLMAATGFDKKNLSVAISILRKKGEVPQEWKVPR